MFPRKWAFCLVATVHVQVIKSGLCSLFFLHRLQAILKQQFLVQFICSRWFLSCHTRHQLLERPLSVVFMDQQNFFNGIWLEAHLVELTQQVQELLGLNTEVLELHRPCQRENVKSSRPVHGSCAPYLCLAVLKHLESFFNLSNVVTQLTQVVTGHQVTQNLQTEKCF